ncbi:MAG: class II glutamine amidotransferase [Legionellales bacterium RIFCSPHIGHO2_12_FULL_37_14]|nr:MAG: class II glutamine amidotransferase [Legionellales bacterium RIFCSPHIGHO2_12_FULL_37_14]
MCRLVAYLGDPILLDTILVKPDNSLVMQSLRARESKEVPTNGDGFGLGWYVPEISKEPAIFTSIFPAWSDKNLLHLTAKIKSPTFFGHVRAASVGGINPNNCHPFIYKNWLFMHNGGIGDFIEVKRHLRHLLDDELYQWIKGETDSEHVFALFLQKAKNKKLDTLHKIAKVLIATMHTVRKLINTYGNGSPSYFNICLTDGERIIATRYCSDKTLEPASMHYVIGYSNEFVLVASERLAHLKENWQTVPANNLLLVHKNRTVELNPILS